MAKYRLIKPSTGETLDLATPGGESNMLAIKGATGLGLPPVETSLVDKVAGHGSVWRSSRFEHREIYLPVLLKAPTRPDLYTLKKNLASFLSPLEPLTLEVNESGDKRTIQVRYTKGLEGTEGNTYQYAWETVGLTFIAPEPYFYGATRSITWGVNRKTKPFLSNAEAFFPIVLAESAVSRDVTITVVSDTPVSPVWEIAGPITNPVISLPATGQKIELTGSIRLGETVTIDTENGDIRTQTETAGQWWERVTLESEFFTLSRGKHQVSVTGSDMTEDSEIKLSWTNKHLTAWA